MFPQTELDNYKLQVELLQEKLKRSEEHRKQLEEKFEIIIKKRSEQEKNIRSKKRAQYHKFLDEQRERNERNKALVKLLDRVDQQAAVLSARSERLKMMKLQYELYFAKLLQAQSMRSIQNSPARFPILGMNNMTATSQPTITVDGMYQPQPQNIMRGPPLLQENWNPLVMNPNMHNNQMFQVPAQMDYMHGQIFLTQPSAMQRQVNFKQTVEEPISPAYSTQSSIYADQQRRVPTEYERYKLNELSQYEDVPIKNYTRTEEQSRDPREGQGSGHKSSGLSFINDSNSTPRKEPSRVHYEKDKSDKIPYERSGPERQKPQHKTPEKRPPEIVDDDDDEDYEEEQPKPASVKKDAVKKETPDSYGPKLQPRTVKLPDTKIDYSPRPEPTTEQPRERPTDLSFGERFLRDVNRLNNEKVRAPVMWNFGGRIEPENDSKYPIQLGKKEKLSIENIENAIYGELINPISRKKEELLENPETPNRYEREIMPVVPLISEKKSEMKQENDEKSDTSEKEEKVLQQNLPLPAITTPVESNPSTPVSETTPAVYSNEAEKAAIHSPQLQEQPASKQAYEAPNSNQEYPNGYPPNYEDRYYNEQPPPQQEQQPPQSQGNSENTTAPYSNYDYPQQSDQSAANYPEQQEQEYPQGQDSTQNIYQGNEYQNPDYQYAGQPDYNQGNEYADYQGTEYQGDYSQQGYDSNAYQYQYDQQPDANYQDPNQPPYEYDPQAYPDQTYAQDYTGSEYANYDATAAIDGGQPPNAEFSQPYQPEAQPPSATPEAASTPADISTIKSPPENKDELKVADIPKPKQEEPKEEPPSAAIQPPSGKPASILATEKSGDANKKKKKVNFLDSESEESSSAPRAEAPKTAGNDESDFEFSSGSK